MEEINRVSYKGHDIVIYPDYNYPETPNDWTDDSVFLVGFHREFDVRKDGITEGLVEDVIMRGGKYEDGSINEEAREWMRQYHIFPLEAYIHGGVSLSLASEGNFPDRQWDVSLLGAVFVSKEDYKDKRNARKEARAHVKDWNMAMNVGFYGFMIEGKYCDDGCWGFLGYPEDNGMIEDAKLSIDTDIERAMKKHTQRRKVQIQKGVPLEKREMFV